MPHYVVRLTNKFFPAKPANLYKRLVTVAYLAFEIC